MGKGRELKDNHLSTNMYTQDNRIAHFFQEYVKIKKSWRYNLLAEIVVGRKSPKVAKPWILLLLQAELKTEELNVLNYSIFKCHKDWMLQIARLFKVTEIDCHKSKKSQKVTLNELDLRRRFEWNSQ